MKPEYAPDAAMIIRPISHQQDYARTACQDLRCATFNMSLNLKPKDRKPEFIAINLGSDKRLFCNACGLELLSDHSCGKCGIFYREEQALHQVQIKGLDGREPGPQSTTIPIAFIDNEPKKQPEMGATFEALKRSGAKITSYSETNV